MKIQQSRIIQPVSALSYSQAVTITRPTNTSGYTAGDAIGVADSGTPANAGSAIHEFTGFPEAAALLLNEVLLFNDETAVISGMSTYRLHLYGEEPTAILDNAAFTTAWADRGKYLGSIEIPSIAVRGAHLYAQATNLARTLKLVGTSLFGVLETVGAYTPTSGEIYEVRLNASLL